jgi:hypothetical protein
MLIAARPEEGVLIPGAVRMVVGVRVAARAAGDLDHAEYVPQSRASLLANLRHLTQLCHL